eukprot:gene11178-12464_t
MADNLVQTEDRIRSIFHGPEIVRRADQKRLQRHLQPSDALAPWRPQRSASAFRIHLLSYFLHDSPLSSTPSPSRRTDRAILQLRGGLSPYLHDAAVSTLITGESLLWLKLWTSLAARGAIASTVTRKIIHATCAPLFILHWPLYSDLPTASLFAAAIPLLQLLRLYWAGSRKGGEGSQEERDLVAAVSRSGKKEEALGGPFLYSAILFLGTLLCFRSTPVGIVAISQMAAGDGLADIVGRRFGRTKWPFASQKSVIGSAAFVLGGFVATLVTLYWMQQTGYLALDVSQFVWQIAFISVLCAAVELVPGVDDNISVPISAAISAGLLLK